MFLDRAVIEITGGHGGDGCTSFRREKYVPRGGPNGGDGGKGGDVWLVVDPQRATLRDFRYRRHFQGERGMHGEGSDRTGRSGEDLLIPVPPGTVVFDDEGGGVLDDLRESGQRVLVARGGRGGRGNARFATSTNRAPRRSDPGEPGETRRVRLELKLIADVGLVGFPNAGKSTLLARISDARPKIADYPFTTLTPNLGVVHLSQWRQFVVADIPGILEGAHEGKGLGLEFLRHIERTRVLLFLIDVTSPSPEEDLAKLRTELAHHGGGLPERPYRVVLTKADLLAEPVVPAVLSPRDDVRLISAVRGDGIDPLLEEVYGMVAAARAADGSRVG
ncbi:MAG: GTPase ObgE [Candidatus Eiseniibacteriota bacterium]